MIKLKIKKVRKDAILPTQSSKENIYDLYAAEDVELNSYESKIIPLGITIDIPEDYRIKIFLEYSLSLEKKIVVSNSINIINENCKNEFGLICHSLPNLKDIEILEYKLDNNHSRMEGTDYCLSDKTLINNLVEIKKGDKIAQFQLEKIEAVEIEEVDELNPSNNKGGGFEFTRQ